MALSIKSPEADRLARKTGEELLFKGRDFAQTDIAAATY
jgi:uncharacterized protein with PIN domain